MVHSCPISPNRINGNLARVIAIFVMLFTLLYVIFSQPIFIYLLFIDFTLRLFRLGAYSPLAKLGAWVLKRLEIVPNMMDEAPKRFALYLGWVMLAAMSLLLLLGIKGVVFILALMLLLFSSLEGLFEFCIGCTVYEYLRAYKIIR